ncbi:MAG: CDP-alcohol phosphatidyltransferase family protein [Patescibacteria group bacterium]|nr:CDP-alcohol phosphatidyltransferase family protein [Patescibacteria group bacterium]
MLQISELKKICRKSKEKYHNWWAYSFSRHFSIYFTWFFCHTPITPNQLTFVQIIFAWLGALSLIIWSWHGIIAWIILMQLSFIFDLVDGEVARYKKMSSLFGVVLDSFGHVLINPAVYWSLSLFVYFQTYDIWIIYLTIALSVFLISPSKHALMRGILFLTTKKDNPIYNYENLSKQFPQEYQPPKQRNSLKNRLERFLKVISEFPNDMNIFCILLILTLIFSETFFITTGLIFFSSLIILKEFYFLYQIKKKNLIEKEYLKIYQK